eukprot:1159055-Pelagomonas_calceolata.AAC.12
MECESAVYFLHHDGYTSFHEELQDQPQADQPNDLAEGHPPLLGSTLQPDYSEVIRRPIKQINSSPKIAQSTFKLGNKENTCNTSILSLLCFGLVSKCSFIDARRKPAAIHERCFHVLRLSASCTSNQNP